MIKPWQKTGSEVLGDFKVFSLHLEKRISPLTGKEHQFTVLRCPDWVNVIALTPDKKIILVEQYRHGTETVELEIPGGVMDAGEHNPITAGLRELREETGYEGSDARVIGKVVPNPAFMANICYTVLVLNCEKKHPLKFDPTEDIATHLVDISDIAALIAGGRIRHSLVVAAFYYFDMWLKLEKEFLGE